MAFEEIAAAEDGKTARIKIYLMQKAGKSAIATMVFHPAVLAEAGWSGSTRLKVMIGTGEDRGWMQIREGGAHKLTDRKGPVAASFRHRLGLGHVKAFADKSVKAAACEWCVKDGMLQIGVPVRFLAPVDVRGVTGNSLSGPQETELQRQHRESEERKKRLGLRS